MPKASIAFGAYKRTGNPDLAAVNCYAEEFPSASGPAIQMRSRAGLEAFKLVGAGPLRGGQQKDGIFEDQAIIVSGTAVYLLSDSGIATLLTGSVAGDDFVDIDSGQDADLNSEAWIATGTALYHVTGTTVTLEDFPEVGGAGATSVCCHRGYVIATEAGTDKAFVRVPGDTTWVALSFQSAEYSPDRLVAIRERGDQFALLGSSSFEGWTLGGSANPPMQPYGGLNFKVGCRSRAASVSCGDSLVFVDNLSNVRRWDGGALKIVSDPGIAEQIRDTAAADLRAWYYPLEGHEFYVLTLGATTTLVYDLSTSGERWATANSLNYDFWRAHLGFSIGDRTFALDAINTQIYRLDPTLRTDADVQFGVEFAAMVDGQDAPIPCANVAVLCDLGDAPQSGQGSAPVISMKMSDNQGKTFGTWRERPLGAYGDYTAIPRWNALGDIPPMLGRVFRFRVADPVGRIFKAVFLNLP